MYIFCYVLPATDGQHVSLGETELVTTTALKMGRCESAPFFCDGSETARDIISDLLNGKTTLPWQKIETVMIPHSLHPTMLEKPVDIIEIFVDDFICAKTIADLTHLLHLSQFMLHGIHEILPPSEVT